jgi:hypothetical protein
MDDVFVAATFAGIVSASSVGLAGWLRESQIASFSTFRLDRLLELGQNPPNKLPAKTAGRLTLVDMTTLDSFVDLLAIALPTILSAVGVLVSLRAPKSEHHRAWRVALIVVGVAISGVTWVQQGRSRRTHEREVSELYGRITALNGQIGALQGELTGLRTSLRVLTSKSDHLALKADQESARRQQAEKDMQLMVQAAFHATRTGVADDLRKAPINVAVSDAVPINQAKMDALVSVVLRGRTVRGRAPLKNAPTEAIEPWLAAYSTWWSDVATYLRANCRSQAEVVFCDTTGTIGMNYLGNHPDQRVQAVLLDFDRYFEFNRIDEEA